MLLGSNPGHFFCSLVPRLQWKAHTKENRGSAYKDTFRDL
jgi:hypothetical protein